MERDEIRWWSQSLTIRDIRAALRRIDHEDADAALRALEGVSSRARYNWLEIEAHVGRANVAELAALREAVARGGLD